jgi:hypothetical protein
MAAVLRVHHDRSLQIQSKLLNPRIACGLMFTKIPSYRGNDVFHEVMSSYGFHELCADKEAAKLLDEKEELLRSFCTNAEVNKMTLKLNFKTVYLGKDILMALDAPKKIAYFLGSTEHRLMLTNYYRDVMPKLAEMLRMAVGGSTSRLTSAGWQNLHDILNDINFKSDFAEVDKVEVMSTVSAARWRTPTLELGVTLLNFQDPRSIRNEIHKEIKGFEQ